MTSEKKVTYYLMLYDETGKEKSLHSAGSPTDLASLIYDLVPSLGEGTLKAQHPDAPPGVDRTAIGIGISVVDGDQQREPSDQEKQELEAELRRRRLEQVGTAG